MKQQHPFILFLIVLGVTFVGGAAYLIMTANPTDDAVLRDYAKQALIESGTESPVSETEASQPFLYMMSDVGGDHALTLELPPTWEDVEHLVDFGGYGPGEGDAHAVGGKVVTLVLGGNMYVTITRIDVADAESEYLPETVEPILKSDTYVYFVAFANEDSFAVFGQTMTDGDRKRIEEATVFMRTLKEIPFSTE